MAAERKLKGEIDRTLKKVQEGQEVFADIWNQCVESENQNQREKLEGELKKEIKKLQRLREQIKGWIAGADIKDKQPLLDMRKSIERDMERFKALEKEAKAKGYGGMAAAKNDPKERAKEESRDWINNTVDSLTSKNEELEFEIEELSATLKKKQKPPPRLTELEELVDLHKEHILRLEKVLRCLDNETIVPDELEDLKSDMEAYLGAEEDGSGIESYGAVDDMYASLQDRLEAVDAAAPAAINLAHGKHNKGGSSAAAKEEAEREREREKEREKERNVAAAAKAQLVAQGNNALRIDEEERRGSRAAALETKASAAGALPAALAAASARTASGTPFKDSSSEGHGTGASTSSTPRAGHGSAGFSQGAAPSPGHDSLGSRQASLATSTSGGLPPTVPAAPSPALPARPAAPSFLTATTGHVEPFPQLGESRLAAAAAAAPAAPPNQKGFLQKLQGMQPLPPAPPSPPTVPPPAQQRQAGVTAPANPAGPLTAATAAAAATVATAGQAGKATTAGGPLAWYMLADGVRAVKDGASKSMDGQEDPAKKTPASSDQPTQQQKLQLQQKTQQQQQQQQHVHASGPRAGLDGLDPSNTMGSEGMNREALLRGLLQEPTGVSSMPEMALPPPTQAYNTQAAKHILEQCFVRALPQPADCEWKRSRPRHPVATPSSYPKTTADVIDNPALFRKVDPECLFFAFYFQPESYQQYLAALELKRQSWRFHKQHNAWFQRFTEPTLTSDEYEQGAYVYFDYNIVHDDLQTGWCYRRKENFTFKYDALEDELRVQPPPPPQTAQAQQQGQQVPQQQPQQPQQQQASQQQQMLQQPQMQQMQQPQMQMLQQPQMQMQPQHILM